MHKNSAVLRRRARSGAGRLEVGTVVAFVSGLAKVNDPWRDCVNWYREMSAVDMRYRLVADKMRGLAKEEVIS